MSLFLAASAAIAPAAAQSGGYTFTAAARSKLIDPDRIASLAGSGRANVIVMLSLPADAAQADPGTVAGIAVIKAGVQAVQDQVLSDVLPSVLAASSELASPQRISRFSGIPGFAASLTTAEIGAMAAHSMVISIAENAEEKHNLDTARPLIGMPVAYNAGATGTGTVVAIIDTGAQINHPFLSGKAIDGGCFLESNSGSYNCPNGTRLQTGSAAAGVNASGASHGTHVAGIAVGKRTSGSQAPESGIGKEAQFIPLNVFGNAAGAAVADQIKALEYVRDRKDAGVNIVAVNMSLGNGARNTTNCDTAQAARKAVIDQLRSRNVATVIASGNEWFTDGIAAPACISSAIAVGSISVAQDQVACYSNIGPQTNIILAPGTQTQSPSSGDCSRTGILSSIPVDSFDNSNGTSMAAPMVAGAWAAIRSCAPNATVSQIDSALKSTGTSITDARSAYNGNPAGSFAKQRIRVDLAAQQLGCTAGTKAVMSSPVNGSTLTNPQTFTWTTGTGVSQYWLYVGSTPGGNNYHDSGSIPLGTTSRTVSGLPSNGSTVYVTLWSLISGAWQFNGYTYTAPSGGKAVITTPTPGSTLSSTTVAFGWTPGTNVSQYWLYVGSTSGGNNYHDSGSIPLGTTSRTVSGLPSNGSTVYVTLWSLISGAWQFNGYTYTAPSGGKAVITTPTPGSTLSSTTVAFGWTPGTNVSQYWLYVGSSAGGSNYHDSGAIALGTTSRTVSGLPSNGSTVYVRLWSLISGTWQFYDATYTATSGCAATSAVMTTPTPGSTLTATSVTFGWTAGCGVSQYWLWVGTTLGSNNMYDASQGTNRSATVCCFPANGQIVYVRLWSLISGTWQYHDYNYTNPTDGSAAVMTSPTSGSILSVTQTFAWNSGTGVSEYWLYVGTAPGSNNMYDASQGTNRSVTLCCFPTNGQTVYVRLWSLVSGTWLFNDYTYTNPTGGSAPAVMTSPPNGSILSVTQTFAWSSGSGVSEYFLYLGTAPGSNNMYGASQGTNRSVTLCCFPTNGQTVYVRLWSLISGAWQYTDTSYRNPTGTGSSSATVGLALAKVENSTGDAVELTKVSDYIGDIVALTKIY